uniref:Cation/H+ exchanger transmembrane domain-containing protein n=1 Tax=Zea mays TaxID=4577 RepID=A0A804U911_MAIZE
MLRRCRRGRLHHGQHHGRLRHHGHCPRALGPLPFCASTSRTAQRYLPHPGTAGIVVGPTVLGRAMDLRQLGMRDAGDALGGTIYFVRMVFMFFIGLELDLRYLRRNLRRSLVVACGGSGFCFVLAVLTGPFTYGFLHPGQGHFQPSNIYASTALFAIVITSTASPVLIRIVTELKLSGSETGQIAIGAAFANDMASLTALSVIVVTHTLYGTMPNEKESSPPAKVAVVAWMALTVWMAVNLAAWVARMLNRLKRGRQYISKYELCALHATLLRGHRCSPRLCQDRQVHGGPARRGRHLAGGAGAGNRDPRGRRAGCAAQRQGLL